VVRADGGETPVRISTLAAGRQVSWMGWNPQGNGIVFRADAGTFGTHELYFAPFDGSGDSALRISGDYAGVADVTQQTWAPGGRYLSFIRQSASVPRVGDLHVVSFDADGEWVATEHVAGNS